MKKILTLMAFMLVTFMTHASTLIDGIYYNLNSSKLTAEMTSVPYGSDRYSGAVSLPSSVTYYGKTYSVTSIGGWAFSSCSSLTSITIPNSVTSIGESAFDGCYKLTRVYISDIASWCQIKFEYISDYGEGFFYNSSCNPLTYAHNLYLNNEIITNLVIPDGVTNIREGTFLNCSNLVSVSIPNSVTSIGDYAFKDCRTLTSITIPSSVTSIGKGAFQGCYSLPVEDNIRYADTYLVEAIDKTLSSYKIKEKTRFIGYSAFYECSSLISISIPNIVTSIGESAFSGCSNLTSIDIPNSVASIGARAFYGCASLSKVNISDIAAWCNIEFNYKFRYYVPPDGESGDYWTETFDITCNPICYAHSLFLNDKIIKKLVIPEGVKKIGKYHFWSCDSLTSVVIPNSVTCIEYLAFEECTELSSVFVENPIPISIDINAFPNRNNCTLYVPKGSKAAYLADDYWKEFRTIVEFVPDNTIINFADAKVKAICVDNWDINGDGELSKLV